MIGWLILGVVIAAVLLVLLSRLKIHLEIIKDTEPVVRVSFLGINLYRFSEEKKSDEGDDSKKNNDKKKDKLNLKKYVKTYDDVIELLHTVKNILVKFKRLLKNVVVKNTEMELIVVGNDAAATALLYGAACSAVYPIINLLSSCVTFKPEKINLSAGFAEKEIKFALKTDFSIRIIYLLKFLISSVIEILKLKKELE